MVSNKIINNRFYKFEFELPGELPENFSARFSTFKKQYKDSANNIVYMLAHIGAFPNATDTYSIRFIKWEFWKIEYLLPVGVDISAIDTTQENIWTQSDRTTDDFDATSFFSVLKISQILCEGQYSLKGVISNSTSNGTLTKGELESLLKDLFNYALGITSEETNIAFWLDHIFSKKKLSDLAAEAPKRITYTQRKKVKALRDDFQILQAELDWANIDDEEEIELNISITKKWDVKKMFGFMSKFDTKIFSTEQQTDAPVTKIVISTKNGRLINNDDFSFIQPIEAVLVDWQLVGTNKTTYMNLIKWGTDNVFSEVYN